jgi:hypothetical protein
MRIAAIAFSTSGAALMERLGALQDRGHEMSYYLAARQAKGGYLNPSILFMNLRSGSLTRRMGWFSSVLVALQCGRSPRW